MKQTKNCTKKRSTNDCEQDGLQAITARKRNFHEKYKKKKNLNKLSIFIVLFDAFVPLIIKQTEAKHSFAARDSQCCQKKKKYLNFSILFI